ncbi:MAG: hypothetical protein Q9191_008031 [Dirinaria sp. TL-2023a]
MAKNADVDISHPKQRTPAAQDESYQKPETPDTARLFRSLWSNVTDDNPLTLYGFRRFRTTHLLNLRLLELEIDKIDRKIYQAGLNLGLPHTGTDKLGLKHSKKDKHAPSPVEILDPELVSKLRKLLREYDEGIVSFNHIMLMETFALADNSWQASLRSDDQNAYEMYKTRLVRVDAADRMRSRDVLRRLLRKYLRAFWFFIRFQGHHARDTHRSNPSGIDLESHLKRSYQKTSRIADIISRFLVALIAGGFLVGPLVILAHQSSNKAHLITVLLRSTGETAG